MKTDYTRQPSAGAILLAGGASLRMGRDKALLCHKGKTMLERAIESVRPFASRILIVADSSDRYVADGAETISDLYPGAGPVGGVVTGLRELGAGCHMVLACDMPLAQGVVLERLLNEAKARPDYEAIVPQVHGEPEPLCAVYRDSAVPKLIAFLESGRRSARQALLELRVKLICESDLRQLDPDLITFTNINTPGDFESLK